MTMLEVFPACEYSNLVMAAGVSILKFVLFCLAYIPLVLMMERRTIFLADFAYPLLRSVRGRAKAFCLRNG